MLSGGQPSADREALVRVLRLAAAPPHPAEVADRTARVDDLVRAYWVAAQEAPVPPRSAARPVRAGRFGLNRSQVLVLRLGGAFVALLFVGAGVATGTGSLPGPVQHGAHQALSAVGLPVPDGTASGSATARPSRSAASPSANTVTMCRQWQAAETGRGAALTPATLRALQAAAGGADKVAGYCASVLALPAGSTPATPDATPAPTPTPTPTPSETTAHPGKAKASKTKDK